MDKNVNKQIRNIILEALEAGDCTRQELLEKIDESLSLPENKPLSPGVIPGVIKSMKKSGKIKSISRGVYQKGYENQNQDIQSKVNRLGK